MKLNNGKGWEVMKAHPSAVHQIQNSNAHQNSSTAVNVHGRQPKAHLPIDPHRLNEPLPKPGATRGPPGRGPRDQQPGKYGHPDAVKRKSMGELAPPDGLSTQALHQHSQPNLTSTRQTPVQSPNVAQPRRSQAEEKPSFAKKLMNILCCGGGNA